MLPAGPGHISDHHPIGRPGPPDPVNTPQDRRECALYRPPSSGTEPSRPARPLEPSTSDSGFESEPSSCESGFGLSGVAVGADLTCRCLPVYAEVSAPEPCWIGRIALCPELCAAGVELCSGVERTGRPDESLTGAGAAAAAGAAEPASGRVAPTALAAEPVSEPTDVAGAAVSAVSVTACGLIATGSARPESWISVPAPAAESADSTAVAGSSAAAVSPTPVSVAPTARAPSAVLRPVVRVLACEPMALPFLGAGRNEHRLHCRGATRRAKANPYRITRRYEYGVIAPQR